MEEDGKRIPGTGLVDLTSDARFSEAPLDEVRRLANNGDPDAMMEMAKRYAAKEGRRDAVISAHWIKRAAEAGHAGAKVLLAGFMMEAGNPADLAAAKALLREAAELGDETARRFLAGEERERIFRLGICRCQACGHENRRTNRFCNACGAELTEEAKRDLVPGKLYDPETTVGVCGNCQMEYPLGSRYCGWCGRPVKFL